MNYDIGACKTCKKIAGYTKDNKCKSCGAAKEMVPLYTWFHRDYNLIEDPETINRLDEMDNVEVKASAVSGAEMKAGLRDLFICLGIAVALLLFGLLCIRLAAAPAKARMTFCGILMIAAAPFMLIVGICLFFRHAFFSVRAKTPEKAFELFWKTVFETKYFSDKYENAEIAVSKISRSLPESIRQNVNPMQLQSWVNNLRGMIAKNNTDLADQCSAAYKEDIQDAAGNDDSMIVRDPSTRTVDEHKSVVSADLVVFRKWTRDLHNKNNDSYTFQMSAGVLHAKTTLLKAGKYWYVPDFMPKAEQVEQTNA